MSGAATWPSVGGQHREAAPQPHSALFPPRLSPEDPGPGAPGEELHPVSRREAGQTDALLAPAVDLLRAMFCTFMSREPAHSPVRVLLWVELCP